MLRGKAVLKGAPYVSGLELRIGVASQEDMLLCFLRRWTSQCVFQRATDRDRKRRENRKVKPEAQQVDSGKGHTIQHQKLPFCRQHLGYLNHPLITGFYVSEKVEK